MRKIREFSSALWNILDGKLSANKSASLRVSFARINFIKVCELTFARTIGFVLIGTEFFATIFTNFFRNSNSLIKTFTRAILSMMAWWRINSFPASQAIRVSPPEKSFIPHFWFFIFKPTGNKFFGASKMMIKKSHLITIFYFPTSICPTIMSNFKKLLLKFYGYFSSLFFNFKIREKKFQNIHCSSSRCLKAIKDFCHLIFVRYWFYIKTRSLVKVFIERLNSFSISHYYAYNKAVNTMFGIVFSGRLLMNYAYTPLSIKKSRIISNLFFSHIGYYNIQKEVSKYVWRS